MILNHSFFHSLITWDTYATFQWHAAGTLSGVPASCRYVCPYRPSTYAAVPICQRGRHTVARLSAPQLVRFRFKQSTSTLFVSYGIGYTVLCVHPVMPLLAIPPAVILTYMLIEAYFPMAYHRCRHAVWALIACSFAVVLTNKVLAPVRGARWCSMPVC